MSEDQRGPISILRGGIDDVDALRDLWLELHHHHAGVAPQSGEFSDDATSWSRRSAHYREWLADPRSFLLLARQDVRLVGYAVVRVMDGGSEDEDAWRQAEVTAEIETLVVTADARGRGLGGLLLDEIDAELARQGITEVTVGLIPGNDGARRLYERRGFRPRWLELVRDQRAYLERGEFPAR